MKQHAPFFTILIILFFLTGCGLFGSLEVEPTATPTTIATPTSERGPAVTPEALPTEIPSSTPTSPPELPEDTPATPTPTPTNSAEEDDEACPTPPGWVAYIVRSGDTLFSLGRATNSTVDQIMSANCLTNDRILAGQILYLRSLPGIQTTSTSPTPEQGTAVPPTISPTPEQGTAVTPLPPTPTLEEGPATGPGDPRLEISPFSGSIPTQYTATLEEYNPNQTVTIEIYFNQTGALVLAGSVIVDDDGNGIFIFSSEEVDPPGLYTLFATGEGGSPRLFGEFQIGE